MPYYQKSSRRYKRNYRRKRTYVRRTKKLVTGQGPTMLEKIASYAGPVATLAKAIVPVVAAINTEAKYKDTSAASTTATITSPYITCFTSMAQGLTDVTRIGNSILMKDFAMNIRVLLNNAAITSDKVVRVVVFTDKMQNGSTATLTELFQDTTSVLSKFNKNYTDRFVIMHDEIIGLHPNFSGALPRVDFKYFNKLDFHARYIGTDSAVASLGPNNIYIVFWPETTVSGDVNVGYYSRLNFTDN